MKPAPLTNILRIGVESGTDVVDATLEADVTVSSLDELQAAGASIVTLADPLVADTLAVTISGSSRLTGAVDIDEGTIDLSGSSIANPSGTARTLEVNVSGASQFDAQELTIEELTIETLRRVACQRQRHRNALGRRLGCVDAPLRRIAGGGESEASGSSSVEPVG